jgi:hypothetical protein
MPSIFSLRNLFPLIAVVTWYQADVFAQAPQEAVESPELPLYLPGVPAYTFVTADTGVVASDVVVRWKQDLRKVAAELRDVDSREVGKVRMLYDDPKTAPQFREIKWRTNPSKTDIHNGKALNALLFDLTLPTYTSNEWSSKPVP